MNVAEVFASDLDDNLKRLMLALVARSDDGIISATTVAQLSLVLGCSERTVQYGLRTLEWGNCIEISASFGRGAANAIMLKGCKMDPKRVQEKSEQNQRNDGKRPYIDDVQPEDCTLSKRDRRPAELNRTLVVIRRRQQVRDGYMSLLSMMGDEEYITAAGLAKHLGMETGKVRSDLLAIFKTLDIPIQAQFRFRKSQRKPWHWRKMDGKVVNFCDHQPERKTGRG
jgi:predicted transcriptional regulator